MSVSVLTTLWPFPVRDHEAVFRQQDIRPDHSRGFIPEGRVTLPRDEFSRLAAVEPAGDPVRLFALDTLAVKQVCSAIKLQEHAPERVEFLRGLLTEWKWSGGDAPVLACKQAAGWQCVANGMGGLSGVCHVRCFNGAMPVAPGVCCGCGLF